jgi:hypothetical protein
MCIFGNPHPSAKVSPVTFPSLNVLGGPTFGSDHARDGKYEGLSFFAGRNRCITEFQRLNYLFSTFLHVTSNVLHVTWLPFAFTLHALFSD